MIVVVSHDHQHRENSLGKNAQVITDVKRNQFHETTRVHKRAKLQRGACVHSRKTRRKCAPA